MNDLHAMNVDHCKVTSDEYYTWLMGVWGDETSHLEPDRWIADWAKRWHAQALDAEEQAWY